MRLHHCLAAAACSMLCVTAALAAPYPRLGVPQAVDLGPTRAVEPDASITLTVALKLRNTDQMETLLESMHTVGSPQYQKFLTTAQFAALFAPSEATIAQMTHHFQAAGFSVARSATAQLKITGSVQAIETEFGVQLQTYAVAQTRDSPAYRFRAPDGAATLSPDIAASVQALFGLSTRPRFHPNFATPSPLKPVHALAPAKKGGAAPNTPDPPGEWTVADFAQYYNVDPIYAQGVSGRHQTIGIVTLASFTPTDALAYWASLGLGAAPSRIKQINIDGGPGAPSDDSGSVETTLDVEQSGGIAPGAQVLVYEAPNTNQGFIDDFAAVVDQDAADTVSVSWGEWEWLDTIPADDVSDPTNGRNTAFIRALNDVLMQAALEGQSFFCAAGDAGAYDANDPASGLFDVPQYPKVLSVDDPAAQTYITTAGGTTLPGPQEYPLPNGGTYTVDIATEQAWGWDYLIQLCSILGYDPVSCGIFPAGGGGGVSSYVPVPSYQRSVRGITATPFGQELVGPSYPQEGIELPVKLPGGFAGRNVPDISLNCDPDTGYVVWYTSSAPGSTLAVYDFYGGTSFAGPQLNGVTSLFNQALHHRLGLLNFALYSLAAGGYGYEGPHAPLRDIDAGDNWYWHAGPGYDQATGVGVPNVSNLLQALQYPAF